MNMKYLTCLLLAGMLVGCATAPKESHRYAWVTGLKPEKAPYYKDLHAHPWPGVMQQIKACHIQNYSIYEKEIDGNLYLFSYLEYTGNDFAADMARMAADPKTQEWWAIMKPMQAPVPTRAPGEWWCNLEEVFHTD